MFLQKLQPFHPRKIQSINPVTLIQMRRAHLRSLYRSCCNFNSLQNLTEITRKSDKKDYAPDEGKGWNSHEFPILRNSFVQRVSNASAALTLDKHTHVVTHATHNAHTLISCVQSVMCFSLLLFIHPHTTNTKTTAFEQLLWLLKLFT